MSHDIELRVASGTLMLSASQILALMLGIVFSVVIARLLGPENYGLVGISLIYPTLIVNLLDLGIGNVLIKYASISSPRKVFYVWSSVILRFLLGFLGFTVTYISADVFASILARPYIAEYVRILSMYVLAFSVLNTIGSIFVGLGRYGLAGSINILQYAIRGVLATHLVLLGQGVLGVVKSYSYAYIALCIVYFVPFLKAFGKPVFSRIALSEVLSLAFPLYLASIVGLVVNPSVNTILAQHASDFDIGNYNVGATSLAPISAIMYSVTASTLSSLPLIENETELRNRVTTLTAYSSLILTFLIGGYMAILTPLIYVLYGLDYRDAPIYASIFAVGHVANAVLTGSVLSGYFIILGLTKWNSIAGIVGSLFTLTVALVLIPLFKAVGAAMSHTIGMIASATLTYLVGKRVLLISISLKSSVKAITPMVAGLTASLLALSYTKSNLLLNLVVSATTYVAVYLFFLPLLIDKGTIENIIEFSSKITYVGFIIKYLGNLYLKLLRVK